jgi:D-glycero-D-manno-heptose 1,7-bisphosphate phosphatase
MTETSQMRPAVFLDRDGTIIKDADYLSEVDQLEVFEFAVEALRLLKSKGFLLIVLTNQSGIARGFFDEAQMRIVNDALQAQLGGLVDAIYFCPHGPDDGCECRKPGVGMIRQAAGEFSIDLANSWIIGDKKSDIETGFNAGIATALVLTGYGESELATVNRMPEIVAGDLLEAARQISSRTD